MGLSDHSTERFDRFVESLRAWRERGVVFVPVRHHSPGCSAALSAALEELKPARVLIEGPREYTAILPALASPETVPPVSVLSVSDGSAAFYPLAPFSPEWVALRWGAEHGAVVDFIDRSYGDSAGESALEEGSEEASEEGRVDDDFGADTDLEEPGEHQIYTLQAERHLARSDTIAALARQLGCRDHDEVWEHLFEVRSSQQRADWREFFDDVAAWSALARLDYDRELLDYDSTHAREAVMHALVTRHLEARAEGDGPIVIVTGGFHTLGLVEALDGTEQGQWVSGFPTGELDPVQESWLIRYDYERLDGLRGYGAGMPAPGFWQHSWDAQRAGESAGGFVTGLLLDIADSVREDGELISTPSVAAAAQQALRLAELRGRAWPGRTDVLDGMLSCFVNDEYGFTGPLAAAITQRFGGNELGSIPKGLASPPLVSQARERAMALRFSVDSSEPKRASLDTARRPGHVERREFLAAMRFLGTGFARQTGGADVITGRGLGQYFEEWQYAWTPMVEATLIELSGTAPTLDLAVTVAVKNRIAAILDPEHDGKGAGATASARPSLIAQLLCEVVAMGARDLVPGLLRDLALLYSREAHLDAVVESMHALMNLLDSSGRLRLGEFEAEISALVAQAMSVVAYQLPTAVRVKEEEQGELCSTLVVLMAAVQRHGQLVGQVDVGEGAGGRGADASAGAGGVTDAGASAGAGGPAGAGGGPDTTQYSIPTATQAVLNVLATLRTDPETPHRVRGCLLGLGYTHKEIGLAELSHIVGAHLRPSADAAAVAALMLGVLSTAPDIILYTPEVLELLDNRLSEFEDDAFMGVLPDLRAAFGNLKPTETNKLAQSISQLTGAGAEQFDTTLTVDPRLSALGQRLESALGRSLVRDSLKSWVG